MDLAYLWLGSLLTKLELTEGTTAEEGTTSPASCTAQAEASLGILVNCVC